MRIENNCQHEDRVRFVSTISFTSLFGMTTKGEKKQSLYVYCLIWCNDIRVSICIYALWTLHGNVIGHFLLRVAYFPFNYVLIFFFSNCKIFGMTFDGWCNPNGIQRKNKILPPRNIQMSLYAIYVIFSERKQKKSRDVLNRAREKEFSCSTNTACRRSFRRSCEWALRSFIACLKFLCETRPNMVALFSSSSMISTEKNSFFWCECM